MKCKSSARSAPKSAEDNPYNTNNTKITPKKQDAPKNIRQTIDYVKLNVSFSYFLFLLKVLHIFVLAALAHEVVFGGINIILLDYVLLSLLKDHVRELSLHPALLFLVLHQFYLLHSDGIPYLELHLVLELSSSLGLHRSKVYS
jgi:hypothetical protein